MSIRHITDPEEFYQRTPDPTPLTAPDLTGDEPWLNTPIDQLTMSDLPDHGRAIVILGLRDMPYEEYLTTLHWNGVRLRTMRKTNFQCVACNKDARDAHHVNYRRKGFERLEDVVALCRACHDIWHATWNLQMRESIRNA